MSGPRSRWEEINAYVDDELPPSDKARVAAAIAKNPAVAKQVAVLSEMAAELKAEAAAGAAQYREDASGPARRALLRNGGSLRGIRSLLYAVAASLVIAVTALMTFALSDGPEAPGLLRAAIERHNQLAQAPGGSLKGVRTLVRFERGAALLPDLEAGRLTLNAVADFVMPSEEIGIAAHYRGTRGCKVTLFLFPAAANAPAPPLSAEGGPEQTVRGSVRSYEWRHGGVGYLLLAEGMSDARLGLIADKLHEASRNLEMLDGAAEQQLAESRRRSAPCLA